MRRATPPHAALRGVRVGIGRPAGRADALSELLRGAGAEPVHIPCITVAPCDLTADVATALADVQAHGDAWWVFTSAAAVPPVVCALQAAAEAHDPPHRGGHPPGVRIAAVGAGTAAALERSGLRVDFVPSVPTGAALGSELPSPPHRAVLWLGDLARTTLSTALAARGFTYQRITAYQTVPDPEGATQMGRRIARGEVDAFIATSPSILDAIVLHTPGGRTAAIEALRRIPLICTAPTTAEHAARLDLRVDAEAWDPSAQGLFTASARAVQSQKGSPKSLEE